MCFDNDESVKILTYDKLSNGKIKAVIEIGIKDNCETIYFDSEKELEEYENANNVTFFIEGLDIDKI